VTQSTDFNNFGEKKSDNSCNCERRPSMLKWIISLIFICLVPYYLNAQITSSFSFKPDSACSGTPILFTSKITSGNTSPKILLWNFGDGVTSALTNPIHTYTAYGCGVQPYTVVLSVTDTSGGGTTSDSFDSIVYVTRKPNPVLKDFLNEIEFSNCDNDPTSEDADFLVSVQNQTINTACISSFTLDWGDGSPILTNLSSADFPLDHTYKQLGAFYLKFTAIAANGCNGTTTYIVKNQSNPAIGLKTDGGTASCAPRTYSFEMSNYLLNSPGTTYQWDFGDDSPKIIWTQDSVLLNNGKIFHAFNLTSCGKTNNEFITTVTAFNSCSSTSATVSGIKMWNKPIADFDIYPPLGCESSGKFCFNNLTVLGAYGSNCDRTTTYLWDFGDGTTSTLQTPPCRTYPVSGPKPVTLTATNKCGNSIITKEILVQKPPVAIAEADTNAGCVPFPVKFTNSSTDSSNLQYNWTISPGSGWEFINNSYSFSKNPEIQFTVAGTYTVDLTVYNSCGSNNTIITINANDIPSVTIPEISDNCFPYIYIGNASYVNNGSTITSYSWSVNPPGGWAFSGTSTAASENPSILFTQAGTYQISVQAANGCGTGDTISNAFEIFTPVPVTVGNDTSVCINSGDFQLAANPSGGTWSGTDVSEDGIFSPVTPGDITLTYSRGTGTCLRQDQVTVRVLPIPTVNAGLDRSICLNNGVITLTGSPSGGIWSGTGITDGTSGLFDPSIVGIGSTLLTYSYTDNLSTCSDSADLLITVLPFPTVFSENVTLCNQPIPEQLTAAPGGGVWSGPDITPGGLFTPDGLGNFEVTYTFTDNNNCSASDVIIVSVINPDTTVSAGKDISMCSNENIFLIGTPAGGSWSGTNVTKDGYFDPASAGKYDVIYSIGIGSCFRADTMQITVKPSPKAGFSASNVCFGETTSFQDQSQGGGVNLSSWRWNYGDNNTSQLQNPPHYYLAPGSYSVKLSIANESGCVDSIVKTIDVFELPVVNFSFDIPACINVPVSFINKCTNAQTFFWEFGDGNTSAQFEPAHTYLNKGSFKVKLTATSGLGCTFSDSLLIAITGPPPQPYFQLSKKEGCGPLTAYVTIDTSQYNKNSSYAWDFGNGLTSNTLVPPDSMVYAGSLTQDTVVYVRFASYNFCDSIVYSDSILVHPIPLTNFGMLHNWDCSPVEVRFKNVTQGSPAAFFWDFGDGSTSTELEPVHGYTTGTSSSIFVITLIAYNGCGTDTLSQDLLVKPNTVNAFFNVDDFIGCEGEAFCFRNYSTDTSSFGITNLLWDFGDGQASSVENPCHTYSKAGAYIAKLYVDNGCGYDETFDTIRINPVPQIAISSNNEACAGAALSFSYSSNVEIGGKTWYFGDGDSSALSNPLHAYKNSGTYEVTLSGESAFGFPVCTGNTSKQVVIKPVPDASILPDTSGCVPLKVTFGGDPGSTHLWNFGDNSAITTNPTHVFESPGLFMVKLVSENSFKCVDSDSTEIRVFPSPQSLFTFTSSGGYPEYLTFTNSSVGATECFWDFGNGQSVSSCAVADPIEYSRNDNYLISLLTLNQFGCSDTTITYFPVNFKGLFVPNALIPEHPDPAENLFLPKGIGIMEYTIQIFDTWGNLIWQSSALRDGMPSEGWNGRDANGKLYPQDVYAWRATAKFSDGTYWSGQNGKTYGTVTLIR
jgi:PKD repeat protein